VKFAIACHIRPYALRDGESADDRYYLARGTWTNDDDDPSIVIFETRAQAEARATAIAEIRRMHPDHNGGMGAPFVCEAP